MCTLFAKIQTSLDSDDLINIGYTKIQASLDGDDLSNVLKNLWWQIQASLNGATSHEIFFFDGISKPLDGDDDDLSKVSEELSRNLTRRYLDDWDIFKPNA
jgi:hypothetical protein